ncbi:GNAT family N-acetyltransferase [Allosphingosinicella deserti]|uniref:Ribosomal-protein-alanine acetyltransferase n=1 Tax=Allosphingosinicella deserti TaxID=2116704 RepID=A0A2P7QIX6_9SPHN|nr:GNAT family N-acetyltransferase [Sphingomonas deserti]PSJ37912.1 ribosomal-protein-alanine acetyltransferase [Sphingomonas deserti]
MSEFTIRPERDDADRVFIRGLNARLSDVIDAPTHSEDEVVAFQDRFTSSAWGDDAKPGATFIAVRTEGQRLGYVHVRRGVDDISDDVCGYVALLAVVAEVEGEGVGQALLDAAEAWAKSMGFRRLALDVFASNQRGCRFYEKAGYRPETIRLIKEL